MSFQVKVGLCIPMQAMGLLPHVFQNCVWGERIFLTLLKTLQKQVVRGIISRNLVKLERLGKYGICINSFFHQ